MIETIAQAKQYGLIQAQLKLIIDIRCEHIQRMGKLNYSPST
uniref:Uncharacterized protein n=1 Tax=Rheinheimera sp. BAL341 TaxID=1708203 RepID=A0A486XLH1_9GAMM